MARMIPAARMNNDALTTRYRRKAQRRCALKSRAIA
jgi:hypothetical protein